MKHTYLVVSGVKKVGFERDKKTSFMVKEKIQAFTSSNSGE